MIRWLGMQFIFVVFAKLDCKAMGVVRFFGSKRSIVDNNECFYCHNSMCLNVE